MIRAGDLYVQTLNLPLTAASDDWGTLHLQYEVRRVTDLRNLQVTEAFAVTCTARLDVPGGGAFEPVLAPIKNFTNYPVLLQNTHTLTAPKGVLASWRLVDHEPRTLNTAVITSANEGQEKTATTSQQRTTGSTTAQSNSYGASLSGGLVGEALSAGGTASYDHTNSRSKERSSSFDRSHGASTSSGDSASMTIKDWGAYAQVAPGGQGVSWIWAQEYPWNVLHFRGQSDGNVTIPSYVAARLLQDGVLLPPSELSQFGVSFTARATWLVLPKEGVPTPPVVSFEHAIALCTGTHTLTGVAGGTVAIAAVALTALTDTSTLDLERLALDPVALPEGAVVGFASRQFSCAPTATGSFRITSETNDLLVRGSGFADGMSADLSQSPVTLSAHFKLLDPLSDVTLHLKHWKLASIPITLTVTVNGTQVIRVMLDAVESSDQNHTSVVLRHKDFASVEYCNFLSLGENIVQLDFAPFQPVTGTGQCVYQLRALALTT